MNSISRVLGILIAILVCSSCGSLSRKVDRAQLARQLEMDDRRVTEGSPHYFWHYLGTEHNYHYFHRQVGRVFYSEFLDGEYLIDKRQLDLGDEEFAKPGQGEIYRSKRAFTKLIKEPMQFGYSIDYGVQNP